MNERALTVFEQYELDITETFKIRGNYGCNTPDSSNSGYWTSTRRVENSTQAWHVRSYGYLDNSSVTLTVIGVRPVITISKSNI